MNVFPRGNHNAAGPAWANPSAERERERFHAGMRSETHAKLFGKKSFSCSNAAKVSLEMRDRVRPRRHFREDGWTQPLLLNTAHTAIEWP